MGYKLGSFNMYKFQAYRSDNQMKKDLDLIANIIRTEQFDIVAMQEVLDEKPMDMILNRLGKHRWQGAWGKPNSRSVQAAEGYAFIWNKDRITLAESVTVSGKRVYQPRIYNQYRIDKNKGQQELVRNPFYGRFKPKSENYEIRIINTHIMFSKRGESDEEDRIMQLGESAMRRNEFEILVKNILAKENTWRYGNNLTAYTILMGDYNLNLNREWTNGPYLQEVIEIDDGRYTYKIRTVQDQLTTVKNRSRLNPDEPARGYVNNYDHFSYDEERFSDLHPKVNRVDSVRKYCGNDFEKHKKEISDHVPISIEIDLKG